MQTITLRFDVEPKAKQSARHSIVAGHVHSYQKGDIVSFENDIAWMARQQLPKDFVPFSKVVHIERLHFCISTGYNSLTNKVKKAIAKGETIYKNKKPDLTDNLSKALFDALSKVVYNDDSLIVTMNEVAKFYGEQPYIEIILKGE